VETANYEKSLSRPNRFGELRKTITGISQKVLTDNLRSMEQDGIIIRTVYAEVPPRVEHKLSELAAFPVVYSCSP